MDILRVQGIDIFLIHVISKFLEYNNDQNKKVLRMKHCHKLLYVPSTFDHI